MKNQKHQIPNSFARIFLLLFLIGFLSNSAWLHAGNSTGEMISRFYPGSAPWTFHCTKNEQAMALIYDDGTIYAWGNINYGGKYTLNVPATKQATDIIPSHNAFTALFNDGTVQTWGGCASPELIAGKKVIGVASTGSAFAALFDDGTVQCWGNADAGGVTPTLPAGKKVVALSSTDFAFTAMFDDGTVQSWGDPNAGGTTPTNFPAEKKVTRLASTASAFVALFDDQTIQCWGNPSAGGATPILPAGMKVNSIASTGSAFAAILEDQNGANSTIFAWGDPDNGGTAPVMPSGNPFIAHIFSTDHAFAAQLGDDSSSTPNTLLCWGDGHYGGVAPTIPKAHITQFAATSRAFATLVENNDGVKLIAWGDKDSGGTLPDSFSYQHYQVLWIGASGGAFAAVCMTVPDSLGPRIIYAWGDTTMGGAGAIDGTTTVTVKDIFDVTGMTY